MKAKVYEDHRGWRYKVMQGLSNTFKARYHKPDRAPNVGWKGVSALPWRESAEEAQADLDKWAKLKLMREVKE